MVQTQVSLLELSGIFLKYIFNPQLVESTDTEPADTEGQLYFSS